MFNAKPVIVEYNPDLTFPKEDFVAKLSSSLKIAVIVNPNNPTGSILTRDEIINITELAAKKDVLIIIDEAYFYFYPRSIIDKIKTYNNLIVLRTFSKLCGMAGLRLGYAAACPEIIRDLRKVKPTFDVNSIAVLFAEELFDNPAVIKTMIEDFNTGRNYLVAKLRREGIDYRMGHANFLLISCGERVDEVIEKMQRKNILVSGGFKQEFLKEYIRVTVGNKAVMEIFWNNFIKIWKGR
jgi:histidinol-phosphate aminotransferase